VPWNATTGTRAQPARIPHPGRWQRCVFPMVAYCLIHEGGYDTIGVTYQKATDAVVGAGKILQVPSREVYLKGPGMIFRGNPASYRTEVQLVVE
jgi:effector-binding domain-containing protein